MRIHVAILVRDRVKLLETAVCRVEVRDVTYADAPSRTVCWHEAAITRIENQTVLTMWLDVPVRDLESRQLTVWARLSLTGAKPTQAGDYVTTAAYPVVAGLSGNRVVAERHRVAPRN